MGERREKFVKERVKDPWTKPKGGRIEDGSWGG